MRRCYGAIIVQNDEIVSSGYNGAPRRRRHMEQEVEPGTSSPVAGSLQAM